MKRRRRLPACGQAALALLVVLSANLAAARLGVAGGQDRASVGFIGRDRVIEMAAAADPSVASFEPSPTALASFVALVDPVHVRMFIRPAQPADLVLAARIGKAVEAAANPALSLELVAVADDLSEPKALVAENSVTAVPEIIVYWMNEEVGRLHPEAGAPVETELADFIFQARVQIAQEMILDHEFFKFTFHKDLLPLDCKRCHGPD
ncbi:MAG: hypothetical protein NTX99_11340 [Candidatus Aminicenantes bacterium]|nr:hypothetical protein [Candidatus Aminicenantes bacterium]